MSIHRTKRKCSNDDSLDYDHNTSDESSSDEEENVRKKTTAKKLRKGEGKESAARKDVKLDEKIDPSTGITISSKVINVRRMTVIQNYYGKNGEELEASKKGSQRERERN